MCVAPCISSSGSRTKSVVQACNIRGCWTAPRGYTGCNAVGPAADCPWCSCEPEPSTASPANVDATDYWMAGFGTLQGACTATAMLEEHAIETERHGELPCGPATSHKGPGANHSGRSCRKLWAACLCRIWVSKACGWSGTQNGAPRSRVASRQQSSRTRGTAKGRSWQWPYARQSLSSQFLRLPWNGCGSKPIPTDIRGCDSPFTPNTHASCQRLFGLRWGALVGNHLAHTLPPCWTYS